MQSLPASANTVLPRYSVLLASATALAYEILLVRLFSISHWHHYAYMIISLALLGYGISGAFLALSQRRLQAHFGAAYLLNLLLFAVMLGLGVMLATSGDTAGITLLLFFGLVMLLGLMSLAFYVDIVRILD